MTGIKKYEGKISAKKAVISVVTFVVMGFCFAAGYDIYARLFKKAA